VSKISREKSAKLYERACELMPAGVNSPVRAFRAVPGAPLFMARGEGAYIWDEDGNKFIDCCGSWGPLILGHGHPEVLEAVQKAVRDGMTFGAPCRGEIELAERVIESYPGIEQVRFVSSGTEAVSAVVRLVRGYTGRDLVLKFTGCYHGHSDALLVAGGSGLATFGVSSSAGVPKGTVADTVVLPLDSEDLVRELFAERGQDIAAVLIEPLPANSGLLKQRPEYLKFLREITAEHGALLVFDEVISGFRLGMDGAAGKCGVMPDIATFGKIVGGGMPVGAFGARREIMKRLAPEGDVYQAGTLSGNPVAMAAGAAALKVLREEKVHARLEEMGAALEAAVAPAAREAGCCFVREGSIFWIAMQPEAPRKVEDVGSEGMERYGEMQERVLDRGVYMAPSGWEVGFLNSAMAAVDITMLNRTLAGELQSKM
jgi:glutamate-1-semialdehyde 2,1-aminomutase